MNAETALVLLKDQLKDDFDAKQLIHVCFDADSKRLYLVNKDFFTESQVEDLIEVVKKRISKDFGGFSL